MIGERKEGEAEIQREGKESREANKQQNTEGRKNGGDNKDRVGKGRDKATGRGAYPPVCCEIDFCVPTVGDCKDVGTSLNSGCVDASFNSFSHKR